MPIDQAHEQLNADDKGDRGIIGLTQNDVALHRWIVAGPEVARLLSEFVTDSILMQDTDNLYHEQHLSAQQSFVRDVNNLVSTMQGFGNPFKDQSDLIVLHTRRIVAADVADSGPVLTTRDKPRNSYSEIRGYSKIYSRVNF